MTNLILFQIKLYFRYSGLLPLGIISNTFVAFIIWQLNEYLYALDIPLLILFIYVFMFGPYILDLFQAGETELINYLLIPDAMWKSAIIKIFILIGYIILLFFLSIFIYKIYSNVDIINYRLSLIYLLNTLPVYIVCGTFALFKNLNITNNEYLGKKIFYQLIVTLLSIVPFIINGVIINSLILSVMFFFVLIPVWYINILPISIDNFYKYKLR